MNLRSIVALAGLALGVATTPAFAERVIIKCPGSCDAVVQAVEASGGTVTHRYKYIKAVAADVPSNNLNAVRKVAGEAAVRKDLIVAVDVAKRARLGEPMAGIEALDGGAFTPDQLATQSATPAGYLFNNAMTQVSSVHQAGQMGQGMKVAVIDSGLRPGYGHLNSDSSVIGGATFVPDGLSFSHSSNSGHGTFVAGMISANTGLGFFNTSPLVQSVATHCPGCLFPHPTVPGASVIPLLGSAPLSSLYIVKVLGTSGSGAQSWILSGMEHVIDLRRAYDAGQPEVQNPNGSFQALNIRVANMSLGGATLFPGRDLEDEMTNAFLEHDIVLVVAAGNAGPSGATIGSPGTGISALTVGAASTATHERIYRDLSIGLGAGVLVRPSTHTQTAEFSARGPNADGRPGIGVMAAGDWNIGQGYGATTSVVFGGGTSFASPTVAGIAAVLRQAVPQATARQVRNALIESANMTVIADGSGPLDQGAGFVNAAAARALLQDWTSVSDAAPAYGPENKNVNVNIRRGADVQTHSGNVTRSATLRPGQRLETFYKVGPNTGAIVVTVSNVTPGAVQNPFFGVDDVLLSVHSAKTSSIGSSGDYKAFSYTSGGMFVIQKPDLGIMRVTMTGSWTNASPIGATVNIYSVTDSEPGLTAQKKIADGELYSVPFTVHAGAQEMSVRLEWDGDWGTFPTNDLDVILQRPDGTFVTAAATINSPERATIANPPAGNWIAHVDGFTVSTKGGDRFKLRIVVDGQVIK
jgi:hypothetical protein